MNHQIKYCLKEITYLALFVWIAVFIVSSIFFNKIDDSQARMEEKIDKIDTYITDLSENGIEVYIK